MKPRDRKSTFILIIILLVIMVPATIVGTAFHVIEANKPIETCDLQVGTVCYNCEYKNGYCNFAINYNDDARYSLNYYKESDGAFVSVAPNYAFIADTDKVTSSGYADNTIIKALDLTTNNAQNFMGVKNYNIGISGGIYFVLNDQGKWAMARIDQQITTLTNFEYDYIGAHNKIVEGVLDGTRFAVLKDNQWMIIDSSGSVVSTPLSEQIYDYNDYYIATNSGNGTYSLYSYGGAPLTNTKFTYVYFIDKYIGVIDETAAFMVYNQNGNVVSNTYDNISPSSVSMENGENGVSVYVNGVLRETLT